MRYTKTIMLYVLVISVTLRVLASIYVGNQVYDLPGTFDQISYHNLALRVLDGHGFSFGQTWWPQTPANQPTAHWSFLYTLYLVVIYKLFGVNPLVARIIQAIIVGILHPLIVYLIGKQVFGKVVGLLSAAFTAVYAYFVYYAANLMTEPFYITAILASLYLGITLGIGFSSQKKVWLKNGYIIAALLGLSLGLAVLLRQLYLLFIPVMFLWVWWSNRRSNGGRIISKLILSLAVIIILILPFTIFNYTRFHRFVLLNTNAGFAFFWANHSIHGTHFFPLLPASMGSYQNLIPVELRQLDEAALDQALLKQGIQIVIEDPVRILKLSLSRIPIYFMFWPTSESGTMSNVSRVVSFGIFWPFMFFGWVLALFKTASEGTTRSVFDRISQFIASPTLLLTCFIIIYSGIHILSWTLIRYRLPVDAVGLIFASYGLLFLIDRISIFLKREKLSAEKQTT